MTPGRADGHARPADAPRRVEGLDVSGLRPRRGVGELARLRDHRPVTGLDVDEVQSLHSRELGHLSRSDPLLRLRDGELGTDQRDRDHVPTVVHQMYDRAADALRHGSHHRAEPVARRLRTGSTACSPSSSCPAGPRLLPTWTPSACSSGTSARAGRWRRAYGSARRPSAYSPGSGPPWVSWSLTARSAY
jgi:hypothetical protein